MEMDIGGARWTFAKLMEYINAPSTCPAFNRLGDRNVVLSIQLFNNYHGRFIEISKIAQHGQRQRIIMPNGKDSWG